jgi:hypothetical protein
MNALPEYPTDHKVGMRVPKGGSSCAKCKYVDGQDCTQKDFIKWNGSEVIPDPTNEYCCDFFEAEKSGGSWVRRASGK